MFLSFCSLDEFFRLKKIGFMVFLVHPTVVLLLLSALVERCFVSRTLDFWILRCFVEKVSNVIISRFFVAFSGTFWNFMLLFRIFWHYLGLLGLLRFFFFFANLICCNLLTFSGKIFLTQTMFV